MASFDRTPNRGESWYGVKLPSQMEKLESVRGQTLLSDCRRKSVSLIEKFVKQRGRTLCGPCSLAIVMNCIGQVAPVLGRNGDLDEENIIEDNRVKDFVERINLRENGATLEEMATVAERLKMYVKTFFVVDDNLKSRTGANSNGLPNGGFSCNSVERFKEIAKASMSRQSSIILNYHMATLGYQDLGGHFSPVGAYFDDRFLILDTWPDTPPAWVKSKDIFNAMATIDSTSKKPRGFLILNA